jgi:hypothetical protein
MGKLGDYSDHIGGYLISCQNGCITRAWVYCGPPAVSRAGRAIAMREHIVKDRLAPIAAARFRMAIWKRSGWIMPAGRRIVRRQRCRGTPMTPYEHYNQEFRDRAVEIRDYAKVLGVMLYIVHGGALTGILSAFSDHIIENGLAGLQPALVWAVGVFSAGVMATVLVTYLAVITSRLRVPEMNPETHGSLDKPEPLADTLEILCYGLGALATICVPLGFVVAGLGLWNSSLAASG